MEQSKDYRNISFLLKELFVVKKKYDYKYEQEEKFNVFSALHHWHDERRLHSRFLSVLLNPEGSHGKGATFLKIFLEALKIDLGSVKNIYVFPTEGDKKEYKDIDILIVNPFEKKAIIIENKIFAGDSNSEENGQLERYFDRMLGEGIDKKHLHTIYLTLDGREPSDESLGRYKTLENIKGKCISYEFEVIHWLEKSLQFVIEKPFLRETILQYKKLVLDMTNNETDVNHRKELVKIIGRNDSNIDAARQLFENYNHIKWHTVEYFWNELAEGLEQNDLKIVKKPSYDDITNITHFEIYRKGQRKKQYFDITIKLKNGIKLKIRNEPEFWLFFGCFRADNKKYISQIDNFLKEKEYNLDNNDFWIFWKVFFGREDKQIYFSEFTHAGTFKLINSNYRRNIIQEIVREVKDFALLLEKI